MLKDEKVMQIIAEACQDEKAEDIVVLDVSKLTVIADYFIIASGKSAIQVNSIVDYVEETLKDYDIHPIRREGHQQGTWVVLDYNFIILHVFRAPEREYYDLENLWGDAHKVEFETV